MMATQSSSKPVYLYFDGSVGRSMCLAAPDQEKGSTYDRLKLDYKNLLRLATADRPLKRAVLCGSVPPTLRWLWKEFENKGVSVETAIDGLDSDRSIPCNQQLQLFMLHDCLGSVGSPGTAVLATEGKADEGTKDVNKLQSVLEKMYKVGWAVEVLSWESTCDPQLRDWVTKNGAFVSLDKFFMSITSLEPDLTSLPREVAPLDLSKRPSISTNTKVGKQE